MNKALTHIFVCFSILLVGCSSAPTKRYSIDDDVAPEQPISVDHIEDATPQYEPYSRGGNKDYSLLGGDYKIIRDTRGFKQEGKASWYGKKISRSPDFER
jgi:rare lipoprotein A